MNSPAKTMDCLVEDSGLGISDLRVAAVLVFAILNLAVFLVRLIVVRRYGALFPTCGGEATTIYFVWKKVHGLPVYGWPFAYPFSFVPYNYLFFETYAFFLRLIGADGVETLTSGRLITPVFAVVGAIAQWKLVQNHLNLRGIRSFLSFFFALGLWFSASIVRYMAITVKPDMAAIAMVMVALWMVVGKLRFRFAYAGVLFYLAWSFKQSVVFSLFSVCLFLLFHKRWRDVSTLATLFAVLASTTILLGTPEYRFNTLVAPRFIAWSVMWALRIAPKSLVANAYWILAPIALLCAKGKHRADNTVRLLTAVLAVSLAGGLAAMTKVGSWDGYLLEAFAAGSTLLEMAVFAAPARFASALVIFGCAQPAIQLAAPQSGAHQHLLGTVGIATAVEYADAVALRDRLAPLKKPLFTTNEIFSAPWFSSDNRAPALVIDTLLHESTKSRCQNGCFEGMLERGEIPSVLLLKDVDPYLGSLNPSYKKTGEGIYADTAWCIYVLESKAPSVHPPVTESAAQDSPPDHH
jgi:hypothetical protein